MKKTILILFLIFPPLLYSQEDMIKTIQKLTLENDSLKRGWEDSRDSLILLKKSHEKEKDKLNLRITNLEKDLKENKLNNKTNSELETQIIQLNDSIELIKSDYDLQIKALNDSLKLTKQSFDKGKDMAFSSIREQYKSEDFDKLIEQNTLIKVKYDLALLEDSGQTDQKLIDLIIYYEAKFVLTERFNEQKVNIALTNIKKIKSKSVLVNKLKINLEDYKAVSEGVRDLLNDIIKLDEKKSRTPNMKKKKKDDQSEKYSSFMRDYDYYPEDFPYLTETIIDFLKRKQKDPDADISDLLKRL